MKLKFLTMGCVLYCEYLSSPGYSIEIHILIEETSDFMIPEPAAWVINTMTKAAENRTMLEQPQKFALEPSKIAEQGEENYGHWVKMYEATDVEPPPADYITVTDQINKGDGKPGQDYQHSGQITIDSGYQAVQASIGCTINYWEANWVVDVIVGNTAYRFTEGSSFICTLALDNERGTIPWGVKTWNTSSTVMTVDIKCVVTEDAINKWKADTHGKLVTAYKARLQEYEEKIATLKLQEGITIEGRLVFRLPAGYPYAYLSIFKETPPQTKPQ